MEKKENHNVICFVSKNEFHFELLDENNRFKSSYNEKNTIDLGNNVIQIKQKIYDKFLWSSTYLIKNVKLEDYSNGKTDMKKISNSMKNNDKRNHKIEKCLIRFDSFALKLSNIQIIIDEDHNFNNLKNVLGHIFTNWGDPQKIIVHNLAGGTTNLLLECENIDVKEKVLVRIYGHSLDLIIDRDREFILHLFLNSLNLSTRIYFKFDNGIIYDYAQGRPLKSTELYKENIYPLIAQKMGIWHRSVDYKLLERCIEKYKNFNQKTKIFFKKDIWDFIDYWINNITQNPELAEFFKEKTDNVEVEVELNCKDFLKKEFDWLKNILLQTSSPIVASHCDLLSGNIIVSEEQNSLPNLKNDTKTQENPIQFIDYEYMIPAPRAFDIANHFSEWQGLNLDRSVLLSASVNNPVFVNWIKHYLNDSNEINLEIEKLAHEVSIYYGLPGFFWGIWCMVQSNISKISFNYFNYGLKRFEEYWIWKNNYLTLNKTNNPIF